MEVIVLQARAEDLKLPHGQWTAADAERCTMEQLTLAMVAGQLRDCGVGAAGQYRGSGCVACDAAGRDTCTS